MLQTVANIISIVAGIITILGIGGIVTWSIFKKGKTQWSDTVLSVFSYGIKTAFCIILGATILWTYIIITTIIITVTQTGNFYFHLAVYCVLAAFSVPVYLVLCSSIYKSSWDPWQRFWEKLFKKKKLEVLEAIFYSEKDPNKFLNTTEEIKKMVLKGKRKFLVDKDILGEPAKGDRKELKVNYRLDGKEKTKTVKEKSTMSLD